MDPNIVTTGLPEVDHVPALAGERRDLDALPEADSFALTTENEQGLQNLVARITELQERVKMDPEASRELTAVLEGIGVNGYGALAVLDARIGRHVAVWKQNVRGFTRRCGIAARNIGLGIAGIAGLAGMGVAIVAAPIPSAIVGGTLLLGGAGGLAGYGVERNLDRILPNPEYFLAGALSIGGKFLDLFSASIDPYHEALSARLDPSTSPDALAFIKGHMNTKQSTQGRNFMHRWAENLVKDGLQRQAVAGDMHVVSQQLQAI